MPLHARPRTNAIVLAITLVVVLVASCRPRPVEETRPLDTSTGSPSAVARPDVDDATSAHLPGLANVVAYAPGFYSGGAPEGERGLDTLASLGVKTIISVDGAAPEVGAASARGIRYVHLPIRYDGIEDHRRLELARAARDAMADGPVYVHCHHGKHRSAAAAASIAIALGWSDTDSMIARMKVSGTSPHYRGLYECAQSTERVSPGMLDSIDGDFPEANHPDGIRRLMVDIEFAVTDLQRIESSGWRTPPDHPGLVPAAEAGILADLLRITGDEPEMAQWPAKMMAMVEESAQTAQRLEDLIVAESADHAALTAQLRQVQASCTECHAAFRDRPSRTE